ncbi:polymer-forming cytoskeletal protein [Nonlabens dokdonensis]|nr:polymer-forming cytoskeletal protein [Nonlabens dokdonensis]
MDSGKSQNRISQGTVVTGDIVSNGGFRIDGTVNGTLKTAAKVVIGKEGKLEGTLECNNADVEGIVSGKLIVDGILTLKSTAKINGEVVTQKLAVDPGASFNATCKMESGVKSIESGKKGKTA